MSARLRVEHGGRLVEHEHIGIHRQHAGDGDALLLTAAHARRIGSAIVAHIHGVQRTGDAQADLIMLNRKILRSERHVVFGDGGDDLVFGMLEHRAYAATGVRYSSACAPDSSNTTLPDNTTYPHREPPVRR